MRIPTCELCGDEMEQTDIDPATGWATFDCACGERRLEWVPPENHRMERADWEYERSTDR